MGEELKLLVVQEGQEVVGLLGFFLLFGWGFLVEIVVVLLNCLRPEGKSRLGKREFAGFAECSNKHFLRMRLIAELFNHL